VIQFEKRGKRSHLTTISPATISRIRTSAVDVEIMQRKF
jgi:hypothetical protein